MLPESQSDPEKIEQYKKRIGELELELERYKAYFDFLPLISHELRTPLSPIMGVPPLLLRTELTQDQRKHIEAILKAGNYLLETVNDLLDFSKLVANKLELEQKPLDIYATLEQLANYLSVRAKKQGITFSYSIAPQVAQWVNGDQRYIRQSLQSLITYASRSASSGGVDLSVECMPIDSLVSLHFAITGAGVKTGVEHLKRNEQFFEQEGHLIKLFPSVSLGLINTKLLCGLMNGKIWVENEPESIAAIHLAIPYVPA